MPGIPEYNAEENITKIQMERNVYFVVVEGRGDAPIYESVINSILSSESRAVRDVVYVGGKGNIRKLIEECESDNYICIADKDFDECIDSTKVLNLSRYSVENFLMCEEAISTALSISLRANYRDISGEFDLDDFLDEVETNGTRLLQALFYYHRNISPCYGTTKVEWTSASIHRNPPNWGLCSQRIDDLIAKLVSDGASPEVVEQYYNDNFNKSEAVAYDLPGKMLLVLLQQYIKGFYRQFKTRGGSQFNSAAGCMDAIVSCLNHSSTFTDEIRPVIEFLEEIEEAN